MLANGDSYSAIEATVPCYRDYINRWRRRFLVDRLEGLRPRYRGQPPTVLTPAMEARVLAKTRQAPPDGSTHWSTRKLGRVLITIWCRKRGSAQACSRIGSSATCSRMIRTSTESGRCHRLYVNPPDQAAVFAVDEKTAIQALNRLDPVLPLSPGRAERHGLNTTGTARPRCLRRSTRSRAKCWGRPCPTLTSVKQLETFVRWTVNCGGS